MNFLTPLMAWAALFLAAAPLIIHLLNRRRFTIVDWAAMDFLREAMQRQRRILRLRDIILLILRTLCVLLFGLALAQPYSESSSEVLSSGNPVHAILVIDNSLSMSDAASGKTALAEAKSVAETLVAEGLPAGSRFSVLPLCSDESDFTYDAYGTVDEAQEAIGEIEVLDRTADITKAVELAAEAMKGVQELPSKHVVFFGDQQSNCWPKGAFNSNLLSLVGGKLNVKQVGVGTGENIWIEDLRVQDEVADVESTTVFIVKLRYEGGSPQDEVQVSLEIDDDVVASKVVTLRPGQARELPFTHRFDPDSDAAAAGFSRVRAFTASITEDKLERDNERYLVVPVLSGIPVVFIDQYGKDEDAARNRYGETFHVRRLLTPDLSQESEDRQLIRVDHVKVDEVDQDLLSEARLVVVAGIEGPGDAAPDLRDYVRQGGQLFIAAGGNFNSEEWNEQGWLGGEGILPSPLQTLAVGKLPGTGVKKLDPFFISFESLDPASFLLQEESEQALEDLYRIPLFFKAVVAHLSDDEKTKFLAREIKRIEMERDTTAGSSDGNESPASTKPKPAGGDWLTWLRDPALPNESNTPRQVAENLLPTILAKYTNGHPMLVERRIGRGKSVLFTSGISSDWNTLTRTNAVLVLDRILRGMLRDTLQKVNFTDSETVRLGVSAEQRKNEFSLVRPRESNVEGEGPKAVSLWPEARGSGGDEIVVRRVRRRGHYVIAAHENDQGSDGFGKVLWSRPLAVNGPVVESGPGKTTLDKAREALPDEDRAKLSWVSSSQQITLSGGMTGRNRWKYMMGLVLGLLLLEILILSWGAVSGMAGSSGEGNSSGEDTA